MVTICERMGFPGAIIVRNGLEGTLAAYLNRPLKIFCSACSCLNECQRQEFSFDPGQISKQEIKVDENIPNPSLEENVRLIQNYKKAGRSGNAFFDLRIQVTCEVLQKAIEWTAKGIKE
jgi:hypothetical protein